MEQPFKKNQNTQGGSGGSASSANPSGVSKKPYTPPASSRVNMDATNHFEGPSSSLESVTNDYGRYINQAVTPSNYIGVTKGGLKRIGSGIAGVTAGIANMASSDGSMRTSPKYTADNVFDGITKPVSSLYNKAVDTTSRGIERVFGDKQPIFNKEPAPTVLPEVIVEDSPSSPDKQNEGNKNKIPFNKPLVTVPSEGDMLINKFNEFRDPNKNLGESKPSNYWTQEIQRDGKPGWVEKQSLGGVQYVQDDSGNILRKDSKGNITKLSDNITRNIYSSDEEARSNSNDMIQRWNDYKDRKALDQSRAMRLASIASAPPDTQRSFMNDYNKEQEAYAISREKNKIDERGNQLNYDSTMASREETAKKNAFEANKDRAIFNRDTQEKQQRLGLDVIGMIQEDQKALLPASSTLSKLKSVGQLNRATTLAVLGDELQDVTTEEELTTRLGELKLPPELSMDIRDLFYK